MWPWTETARGTAMGIGTGTVKGDLCVLWIFAGVAVEAEEGVGNVAEANWRPHFLSYAK